MLNIRLNDKVTGLTNLSKTQQTVSLLYTALCFLQTDVVLVSKHFLRLPFNAERLLKWPHSGAFK